MRAVALALAVLAACASSSRDNSCLLETDCSTPGLPYCIDGTCVACSGPQACTSDAPRCSLDTFTCGGCTGDLDCTLYPSQLRCAPEGSCVGCLENLHCANPAPVCDLSVRECRACRADDECASTVCDIDAGTCVATTAILYAAPGASDAAACTQAQPCSVGRAIVMADALRRTVRMLPGTYAVPVTVSGATKNVTIVGTGATLVGTAASYTMTVEANADVTMRGLAILPVVEANTPAVRCFAASGISTLAIRDMTVAAPNGASSAIQTSACQLTLKRATVPGPLTFNTGTSAYIDRSHLGSTVYFGGTSISTHVTSSVFVNSNLDFSNLGGSTNIHVSFSTFYGGAQHCSASQLQPTILFDNNIFVATDGSTDSINGARCTYDRNLAFPQATNLGLSTIRMDPKFVDAAAGNFRLQAGSPAIDAASDSAATTPDFDGTARPQGPRSDLGAYEYK